MKYLFFPVLMICLYAGAQPAFNDSISTARYRLDRTAMTALGSWGLANMTTGFIAANSAGPEASRFWRMNAYWGMVNLGLAAVNLVRLRSMSPTGYSFADNFKAQQRAEKIYLINFGLDITYITAGWLLASKGNIETNAKSSYDLKGYGKSIVLQGAVLLVMDGLLLHLHQRNTARMNRKLRMLVP